MKKNVYLVIIFIFLTYLGLFAQDPYKGFAVGGTITNNLSTTPNFVSNSLVFSPKISYFTDRNNQFSITPSYVTMLNSISSNSTKYDLGFSYAYTHWFINRIGLKGSFNINNLLSKSFSINSTLSLQARVNERIDIGLNIATATLYSKIKLSESYVNTYTDTEYQQIGIPSFIYPSISFTYRFSPDNFNVKTEPILHEGGANYSFGFHASQSTSSLILKSSEISVPPPSSDYNTRVGFKLYSKPLKKLSYGLEASYTFSKLNNSTIKVISIGPLVRVNYFNVENFALYAEGNLSFSGTINSYSSTNKTLSVEVGGKAGISYLVKNKVLISLEVANIGVYHNINAQYNTTSFEVSPLNISGISAALIF